MFQLFTSYISELGAQATTSWHNAVVAFDGDGLPDGAKTALGDASKEAIKILSIILPILAGLGAFWVAVLLAVQVFRAMKAEDADSKREHIKNAVWKFIMFLVLVGIAVSTGFLKQIVIDVVGEDAYNGTSSK